MSAPKEEAAKSTVSSAAAAAATATTATPSSPSTKASTDPIDPFLKDKEEIVDIRDPNVVTKYKKAAEIVNGVLGIILKQSQNDTKIIDLVTVADQYIVDETSKIYNTKVGDKKTEKGIAFPTAISVNNIVGHFSPLSNDTTSLHVGDVVKIDVGVHVDGYVAVGAHTFVLGGSESTPTKGKVADVLTAVHTAAEASLRLLKPGNKNSMVTSAINKIASEYKVNAVQGVLSHRTTRYVIDDAKVMINREDAEQRVEEVEFGLNEVWGIDIVFSTGEGKPKEVDDRTTIFKRNSSSKYSLKMKASRSVLSEIDKRFPSFPFTLRAIEEESKARFAIKECREHDLVTPYPVLHEKEGEIVAQTKFTVFITEKGAVKISGLPFDSKSLITELKVQDEEIKKLLNSAVSSGGSSAAAKKKKAQAAKKKAAAAGAGGETDKQNETAAATAAPAK